MFGLPFTKMFMLNDNRESTITGVAVEYNLLNRTWKWYKVSDEITKQQTQFADKVLLISSLMSPLLIVPIIALLGGYTNERLSPLERLQQYHNVIPMLLGLLLFFAFATLAAYRPKNYIECSEPNMEIQLKYLTEVYESSIRHNNAVGEYKTPYLVNVLSFGIIILCIPITFYLYNQPDTLATFLLKLVILGILISVCIMGVWAIVIKALIIKRKIKKMMI